MQEAVPAHKHALGLHLQKQLMHTQRALLRGKILLCSTLAGACNKVMFMCKHDYVLAQKTKTCSRYPFLCPAWPGHVLSVHQLPLVFFYLLFLDGSGHWKLLDKKDLTGLGRAEHEFSLFFSILLTFVPGASYGTESRHCGVISLGG